MWWTAKSQKNPVGRDSDDYEGKGGGTQEEVVKRDTNVWARGDSLK